MRGSSEMNFTDEKTQRVSYRGQMVDVPANCRECGRALPAYVTPASQFYTYDRVECVGCCQPHIVGE